MKFCKDCKYYKYLSQSYLDTGSDVCTHPDLSDLVTGKPTLCEVNRANPKKCGEEGHRFIEKEMS